MPKRPSHEATQKRIRCESSGPIHKGPYPVPPHTAPSESSRNAGNLLPIQPKILDTSSPVQDSLNCMWQPVMLRTSSQRSTFPANLRRAIDHLVLCSSSEDRRRPRPAKEPKICHLLHPWRGALGSPACFHQLADGLWNARPEVRLHDCKA